MAIAFLKLTQISTRATNDMRIFVVSGINKQKEVRGLNWCFISGCVVKKIQKVPKCQSGKREEEGGFKLVSMFCLAGAALAGTCDRPTKPVLRHTHGRSRQHSTFNCPHPHH